MKKIIVLLACLALLLGSINIYAEEEKKESYVSKIFAGEHSLIPMFEDYYFASMMPENRTFITLCWQDNDGQYRINTILIEKIRLNIIDYYDAKPTIKFRWRATATKYGMQKLFDDYVVYILVTCTKEQWKIFKF